MNIYIKVLDSNHYSVGINYKKFYFYVYFCQINYDYNIDIHKNFLLITKSLISITKIIGIIYKLFFFAWNQE